MASKPTKWAPLVVTLSLLVALAAWMILRRAVNEVLSPEKLVERLEQRYPCRAEIGEVTTTPGGVSITGLVLARRDEYVAKKIPHAEREPIKDPVLRCDLLQLDANWKSLFRGNLNIRELLVDGFHADIRLTADGRNTLAELFDSDDGDDKSKLDKKKDRSGSKDSEEDRLHIDELPVAGTLRQFTINNANVYVHLEKYKTRLTASDFNLEISDLATALKSQPADAILSGAVALDDDASGGRRYGQLNLDGSGTITLFDPNSGFLDPRITCRMNTSDGSYIDVMPVLDRIEKKIGKLDRYGINLENVDLSGNLTKPSLFHVAYQEERYQMLDTSNLNFSRYRIDLRKGSWYELDDNLHEFAWALVLDADATRSARAKALKSIGKRIPFLPSETAVDMVMQPFMVDDEMHVKFRSNGALGKPEVDFLSDLPALDKLLKNEDSIKGAVEALKGLKSLFD